MRLLPRVTIIDRYFARQQLGNCLYCLAGVVLILSLMSVLLDMDTLSKVFETQGLWRGLLTVAQYYTVRLVALMQYLGIGMLLLGTAFTFYLMEQSGGQSVRSGEVFPIITSGYSRWRVARPFCVVSVATVLVLACGEELFYTYCNEWPGANSSSMVASPIVNMREKRDPRSGIEIKGRELDLESGRFEAPKFIVPTSVTHFCVGEIMAEQAVWRPADDRRPTGFLLSGTLGLEEETWLPSSIFASPEAGEDRLFYLPSGTPGLAPGAGCDWVPDGGIFIASVIRPIDLNSSSKAFLPDSIAEMRRKLGEPTDQVRVATRLELHSRIVRPALEIGLMFIAIPLMLSGRSRYRFMVALGLIVIFALFLAIPNYCAGLADRGELSPVLAAWIPVFLFGCAAGVASGEYFT